MFFFQFFNKDLNTCPGSTRPKLSQQKVWAQVPKYFNFGTSFSWVIAFLASVQTSTSDKRHTKIWLVIPNRGIGRGARFEAMATKKWGDETRDSLNIFFDPDAQSNFHCRKGHQHEFMVFAPTTLRQRKQQRNLFKSWPCSPFWFATLFASHFFNPVKYCCQNGKYSSIRVIVCQHF